MISEASSLAAAFVLGAEVVQACTGRFAWGCSSLPEPSTRRQSGDRDTHDQADNCLAVSDIGKASSSWVLSQDQPGQACTQLHKEGNTIAVPRLEEENAGRRASHEPDDQDDRDAAGQADVQGLVVHPQQLLHHVVDRHDEQPICLRKGRCQVSCLGGLPAWMYRFPCIDC